MSYCEAILKEPNKDTYLKSKKENSKGDQTSAWNKIEQQT